MKQIRIDADALFRAVTATGYKLLAFHLDLNTGEIVSRTLRPDEVADAPQGPSVAALPKLGGDLTPKKDALPFGPLPVAAPKKDLFGDDGPKKEKFGGDFWKRDSKKADPFGKDGFRRESATKKLAEMFGEGPAGPRKPDPFASLSDKSKEDPKAIPVRETSNQSVEPNDPQRPRIPAFTESQVIELMQLFAKDAGDPQIKAEMISALSDSKPEKAFERVLRKYARTTQQWERYFRKQALLYAETWLSDLGIAWELDEKAETGRGL
jgi:Uncharacterised protein family (UPF0158)